MLMQLFTEAQFLSRFGPRIAGSFDSESKPHRTEKREKRVAGVNVFKTLAGLQRGSAARKDDVFRKRRAVFDADSEVLADGVMNGRLKEEKFERLGAFKTEKVEICEAPQLGGDVEIGAGGGDQEAGIHEVCLAFFVACPERRYETPGSGQESAGAGEANAFAIPETEQAACKIGKIDDGVETAGARIARVRVTGSVEDGKAVTHPIFIVREFGGGHLGIDGHTFSRNRIEGVFAEGLIEGVRE